MKDGKIYTPEKIVDFMLSSLELNNKSILEPSCGDGNFVSKLPKENLTACDVDKAAIDVMCKRTGFKGINTSFLTFQEDKKYDLIVGNPPYIRTQDLDEKECAFIKSNFESCKNGSINYFYSFIEKALRLLSPNGIMKFIIPNTWLINSSAKKLRKILLDFDCEIYDFENEKVFENADTYTCILTAINRKSDIIKITKNSSKETFVLNKASLKNGEIWAKEPSLPSVSFQNGIATLGDKLFIFESKKEDAYYSKYLKKYIPLEKEVIKKIYKASTGEIGYCIYPYDWNGKEISNIENYGLLWSYFLSIRQELENRAYDSKWYLYGRSQGLKNMYGRKLAISTICSPTCFKFKIIEDPEIIIYSGIFTKDIDKGISYFSNPENLKYVLENGKKLSGGYASFSKGLLAQ